MRRRSCLTQRGYVAECTGDNIFMLKDGRMFTPPLSSGALHGITRGTAIDLLAELGVPTSEPNMTRYDLFNADECFLTGTGAEIVPVVKIDQRVIGNGKAGAGHEEGGQGVPRTDQGLRRADRQALSALAQGGCLQPRDGGLCHGRPGELAPPRAWQFFKRQLASLAPLISVVFVLCFTCF